MGKRTLYRLEATPGGHLWFCLPLKGGWTACYRLLPRDGRPVVVELRVVPTPPDGVVHFREDGEPQGHHEPPGDGLTAATLKDRVVMGKHIYEILPAAIRSARRSPAGSIPVIRDGEQVATLFDAWLGSLGFDPDRKPKRGRRGPKGYSDEHYARVAADYIAACESGSRSPVLNVAEARGMTAVGMRAALHRARTRGLLTRQTAGRAGGELTAYGESLLQKKRR